MESLAMLRRHLWGSLAFALAFAAACIPALVLAPVAPALAQGAVLCGCYCGITISPPCSEQACKAACGYSEGGGGRGGGSSAPAQVYYCRAVAPDGAWGWASSSSESWARQNALAGCRKHAEGCRIENCRINDPTLAQAPPASARPPAPAQSPTTPEAAWCATCIRKLQADVDKEWASGLIRVYVGQAIAGYENCKQKAGGMCAAGDQMVARLRACGNKMFDAYRGCLTEATEVSVDHYAGTQRPAYDCSVCDDGLERNVAAHIGNPRMLATYVDQAIAYYENCRQRAGGSCMAGDLLVRTLRSGCDQFRPKGEDFYHACVKKAIEQRQQQH
jgi:hypothetical protein